MRLLDTCRFSLGSLFRQKLRSFLTVVGVAVGTGAIVVMVSLGEGLRRELVKLLESGEALTEIRVMQFKPAMNFRRDRKGLHIRRLREEDVAALKKVDGVLAAWPDLQMFAQCEIEGRTAPSPVIPLPTEALTVPLRKALIAGQWWNGEGADAVVPLSFLRRKMEKDGVETETDVPREEAREWVGKTFAFAFPKREPLAHPEGLAVEEPDDKGVRRVKCRIAGVLDDSTVGQAEDGILVPLAFGKGLQALGEPQIGITEEGGVRILDAGEYRSIQVKAVSIEEMPRVKERVEAMGYPTFTVEDIVSIVDKIALVLKAVLGCIGGIGLIVAFFGIVNTMVMAILERTREIGMLKALGARNRDIRRVFLGEASSIGLIGALVGLGGGWFVGWAMNAIARAVWLKGDRFTDVHLFQIPLWLSGLSIAFGVFVAAFAGLYPAVRASRLDPVTALRNE